MSARPSVLATLLELEQRVAHLERGQVRDRYDVRDSSGRLRVRVGLQADGTYGVRIWSSAGALIHDLAAA